MPSNTFECLFILPLCILRLSPAAFAAPLIRAHHGPRERPRYSKLATSQLSTKPVVTGESGCVFPPCLPACRGTRGVCVCVEALSPWLGLGTIDTDVFNLLSRLITFVLASKLTTLWSVHCFLLPPRNIHANG